MPDLANSDTNRSSSFGRTGNAYDVRFSPGGSSGGTVTAVAANMAVLGNGTDTGNSIPHAGRHQRARRRLSDTRTGQHRRHRAARLAARQHGTDRTNRHRCRDRAGGDGRRDPLDPRTVGTPASAQRPPYDTRLKADALKGKRFGVPAFILAGDGIPFHGIPAGVLEPAAEKYRAAANMPLRPRRAPCS